LLEPRRCPPIPYRRGEALARRLCGVESAKPAVDLEDEGVVAALMGLVLGGDDKVRPRHLGGGR
jgi:hypothetical protein